MREIKFRAWCVNMKEMIIVSDIHLSETNGYVKDASGGFTKHFELMQFTGLKDKNGKDIYEGDILDGEYVVYYFTENAQFIEIHKEDWNRGLRDEPNDLVWTQLEVTGNIYETLNY